MWDPGSFTSLRPVDLFVIIRAKHDDHEIGQKRESWWLHGDPLPGRHIGQIYLESGHEVGRPRFFYLLVHSSRQVAPYRRIIYKIVDAVTSA